jgi:hypothetical protein
MEIDIIYCGEYVVDEELMRLIDFRDVKRIYLTSPIDPTVMAPNFGPALYAATERK